MKQPKIVIIDYKVGNTQSVFNSIKYLGYNNINVSSEQNLISNADVIVLPGVGAFEACLKNLQERNLIDILNQEVIINKKPVIGICIGMQLMADLSEENGIHNGLGWIQGKVKKLSIDKNLPVPHVGWNSVTFNSNIPFKNEKIHDADFYFDHSYFFDCNTENTAATVDYGKKITAAVRLDNIFGIQFHPEKSHINGLKLFRSFFNSI